MKRRNKLQRVTPFLLGTCLLTFVAACGSDDDSSSSSTPSQEQTDQGSYSVVLAPVNGVIAPDVDGTGEFTIVDNDLNAKVSVSGAPSGPHLQFVFTGGSCPDSSADANGDTYVDVTEALPSAGAPLVPLDADLNSQLAGFPNFPVGGSYNYDEDANFNEMLTDLRATDTVTTDSLVKLGPNDDLELEGKVVIVHGVSPTADLPDTVASIDNLPATSTLPIACGVIQRVADDGGTTGGTDGGTTGGTDGGTTGGTDGGTTGGTDGGTTGGTDGGTTGGTDGGTTGGTDGGTTGAR